MTRGTAGSWLDSLPNELLLIIEDKFWMRNASRVEPGLYSVFPVLSNIETPVERNFDSLHYSAFCMTNLYAMMTMCVLYLLFTFLGRRYMEDRKPYNLRGPLAAWNLFLAVFSFVGMLKTAPHLIMLLRRHSLYFGVCHDAWEAYGTGASGFWTVLFIHSKLPEMLDTAFIVLRKKPLMFLHWYHHVTVYAFCWHALATQSSAGLWFISMNYTVHSVMYFYYFLTALGFRPPWAPAITIMQLAQMVGGTWILALVAYYASHGLPCDVRRTSLLFGAAIYVSYGVLFAKLFGERYCCSARAGERKGAKKE
jgi:hypothetical protein